MGNITPDMSIMQMIMTMGEGNPGALNVAMEMMNEPAGFLDLLLCDSLNIRGSKLYMLHNDCCRRNKDKLNLTLMMIRCGVFSEEEIQANLNLIRAIPFIDDSIDIDRGSSYGEDLGPDVEEWKEFCAKNREVFIQKLNTVLEQQNEHINSCPKI